MKKLAHAEYVNSRHSVKYLDHTFKLRQEVDSLVHVDSFDTVGEFKGVYSCQCGAFVAIIYHATISPDPSVCGLCLAVCT